MSFTLPTWVAGYPPHCELVALACRKWVGNNNGRYLEVVAGDPSSFLTAIDAHVVMEPRVIAFTGCVIYKGDLPYILNEYGAPTAFYPDSILAWSPLPDGLPDLSAAASTNMVIGKVMR